MSSAAIPATRACPPPAPAGVFARLTPHLSELDLFLRSQLSAFEPEIRPLARSCIENSGKRIRPSLVFLSGWQGPEAVPPELVRAASVVELVHLATLVHDDIMDRAEVRRGQRTAARAYGSETAVLLGDALFAQALFLATQFPTTEVCAAVSESARRVCSGEIVQTLHRGSIGVSRADYQRIVDLKTAELFRVSCHLGARLAGAAETEVEAASRFGRHLGIAYQIYDDLLDFFGEEARIGKTLGTDFQSGKLTLPLIALLERLPEDEREGLVDEIVGRRAPRPEDRFRQMADLDVFASVAAAFEGELSAASAALKPWRAPAVPLLLDVADVLRGQLNELREAAN